MRRRATGVDDTLGDAHVVEVEDFFAKAEIFQKCGAARTDTQAVLVVGMSYPPKIGQ